MGTGYTRNDVSNNIADGNIINAADLDGEFDAVESAFNSSTGHTHDGTAAEGGAITVVGPVQDLVVSATEVKPKTTNTLDLGTSALLYKDAYLQGNMYFRDTALKIVSSADGQLDIDADVELELVAPTVDIDASTAVTVDTASTTFTSTLFNVTGSANITGDLDVDNININGNTIISTDTNGDINISPDGTGTVVIDTDLDVDNININGNTISSTDTNGNINLSPNGTGVVALSSTDLTFGDNDKAIFGAGSDLQIYHDGSASYIDDAGTGALYIRGNAIVLEKYTGERLLDGTGDAAVKLYYDNAVKLATTATGVDVTGTVTSDGLTLDNAGGINSDVTNLSLTVAGGNADTSGGNITLYGSGSGAGSRIRFRSDSTERMRIENNGDISFYDDTGTNPSFVYDASGALIVNEDSRDFDFRVESNGNTHMLFVDGGANAVNIGTSTAQGGALNIGGNASLSGNAGSARYVALLDETSTYTGSLNLQAGGGSSGFGGSLVMYGHSHASKAGSVVAGISSASGGSFRVEDAANGSGTEVLAVLSNAFIFNDTSQDRDFRVESNGNANALFVDAGNNRIGFFNSSPSAPLHLIAGSSGGSLSDAFQISDSGYVNIAMYSGGADGEIRIGAAGVLRGSYKAQYAGTRSAHDFHIGSNSTNMISFDGGGSAVIVNEAGADRDFRVESDTDTHALFVDAGNSRVGINNSTPDVALHVITQGTSNEDGVLKIGGSASALGLALEYDQSGSTTSTITANPTYTSAGQKLILRTDGDLNTEQFVLYGDGNIVANEGSRDADFRVESNGNTHMLFVDAGENKIGAGASSLSDATITHFARTHFLHGGGTTAANTNGGHFFTSRQYDVATDGWITFGAWDNGTTRQIYYGGGNWGVQEATNHIFYAGSYDAGAGSAGEAMRIYNNTITLNELSRDQDFRVESDSNANMLFVDAGNDLVLIGKNTSSVSTTGINIAAASMTLSAPSGNTYHTYNNSSSSYTFVVSAAGTVTCVTLNETSDIREKQNIVDLPVGLDAVKKLRPRQFDWINEDQENNVYGFIAQEVEEVLPTIVSEYQKTDTETRKSIKKLELVAVLTKALQEQQTIIESLEARITALEAN